MESLVDITTTAFQANLGVIVIFLTGYLVSKRFDRGLGLTLSNLSDTLLLPALVFTVFASSSFLTWKRLLQIVWPSLIIALATHLPSLGWAFLGKRYFSSPAWIAQSIVYNNVSSYPLLVFATLSLLSTPNGVNGVGHLKWRVLESINEVQRRAILYILLNLVVTKVARALIVPLVDGISPPAVGDHDSTGRILLPPDAEDATENTPLVASSAQPRPILTRQTLKSPLLIASLLGIFIAIVKPVQRWLVGVTPDQVGGTWLWQTIGHSLLFIGELYAALDIIRAGTDVKETETSSEQKEVPPTVGTVITISFWRYVIIPLISIPIIYGFRQIPSAKFYLQDPAFSFVLALSTFAPPTFVSHSTPFQSSVIFSTFLVSIVTSISIAVAVAISGRGVSYETNFDLVRALKSAGGGGLAGAAAMVVQVLTLMPMRTIMNYQYRYGGSLKESVKKLWADGGFKRYYAGLAAALFQGPFARFGDTAANAGIIALLDSLTWPVLVKTIAASLASACFRMILTPIDTLKTTQQTKGGKAGLKLLKERIKEKGIGCLWYGALATAAATFVGHYPWFGTYNYLQAVLPPPHNLIQKLLRQAFIGFAASVVSDTISNSLRVVKTYRQVHEGDVGYLTAAKEIVASEGLLGLFGRGLPTRLITNGLQGLLFSILWKFFADLIAGNGTGK